MLLKFKFTLTSLLILVLSNLTFAGSLPLNTGYDYSNFNIYQPRILDDYWIRISSFPTLAVGPAWSVSQHSSWALPMALPTGVPSTWINAFSDTNASPGGTTQTPAYAIYRKCFCLPVGYRTATIQGRVRNDDAIQIWLNTITSPVLGPLPVNQSPSGTAYNINYAIQGPRTGRNCIYVLLEDTGGAATGFNLAASLNTELGTPLVAQGSAMSFGSCTCAQGPLPFGPQSDEQADAEDREIIDQIVQIAEQNRIERANSFWPLEK